MKMTEDEYHSHYAMSKSRLDLFARDENSLAWTQECPVDTDKMKVLDFGKAMHVLCLEPHRINEYVEMPKFNLRSNAGKEEKAQFEEEHAGKKILTADDYKKLRLMYASIMAHPAARKIIETDGLCEESYFFTDKESGVDCRVRTDKLFPDLGFVADIKTTDKLSNFKFSVDDYRYYVQDPFYRDGLAHNGIETTEMRFLVVQTTIELGRYPCAVYTLPSDVVEYGREVYRKDLKDYAAYLERDTITESKEIDLHHWFLAKVEDELTSGIV